MGLYQVTDRAEGKATLITRFLWSQADHLPASLEAAPRMRDVYGEQVGEALDPFRRLVWPELRGWGHSFGTCWVEGQADRQAAQISWEVSRCLTAEHCHHLGARRS